MRHDDRHAPRPRCAGFRFYAELNDFLPPERRQTCFDYPFSGTPAVRDAIQALGVPHTAVDLVRTYHPERGNEARLTDQVESDLRRVVELGFARQLRDQPHTYEVRRILKAFIDAQWLSDFEQRMTEFLQSGEGMAS